MVAIDGAAGSKHETLHPSFLRRAKHVHKPTHVALVGRQGIGNRSRHGPQGGLMKHVIDSLTGPPAGIEIRNVGLDKREPIPLVAAKDLANLLKITLAARG